MTRQSPSLHAGTISATCASFVMLRSRDTSGFGGWHCHFFKTSQPTAFDGGQGQGHCAYRPCTNVTFYAPPSAPQACGAYTASGGQTMPWSAALYEPTRGSFIDKRIIPAKAASPSTWDSVDVPTPLSRTRCLLPTLYAPCSSALHMLTSPEYEPRAWAGRQVLFHLQHRVVQWGQLLLV